MIRLILRGLVNLVHRDRPETAVIDEVSTPAADIIMAATLLCGIGAGSVLPISADLGGLAALASVCLVVLGRWIPGSQLLDAEEWQANGRPLAPWEDEWGVNEETTETRTESTEGAR
ncbi:hypothetical protein SAMN06264867_1102 [Halorubrum cibi]|uniref:Uncharacterized protein n=1 Tax=Halorubrum cibi TaxID=413815 RepID=A0A521EAT1_9EURY|nr:hypothetical protein SAMN06264867_1102 [Halorubrum cibi]